MRTIHKYALPYGNRINKIELPKGAKPLMVSVQNPADDLFIWFEVNDELTKETRSFEVIGTGQTIPDMAQHIGSVKAGSYIWHVYEVFK